MKAKDKLRVTWSRKEDDLMFHWPAGVCTSSDANWLYGVFSNSFLDELEGRGYDLSTLKFSIEPTSGCDRFASQRGDNQ